MFIFTQNFDISLIILNFVGFKILEVEKVLRIFIQGLKDGIYDVDEKTDASSFSGLSPEYQGDISLIGKLYIVGKRYSFKGKTNAKVVLECDLSLEEYEENIEFDIKASFFADNELFFLNEENEITDSEQHIINEDDKYLDLTDDIREELIVHLPMKRIHPKYKGKTFEQIHPELSEKKTKKVKKDEPVDDRWSALKNLKLN